MMETNRCPVCHHGSTLNGRIVHASNCSIGYPHPDVRTMCPVCGHINNKHLSGCLISLSKDRITELEAQLAKARVELKKLDPDPVVCGCREAICPHTPIVQLPRQELVNHFRTKLARHEKIVEAAHEHANKRNAKGEPMCNCGTCQAVREADLKKP